MELKRLRSEVTEEEVVQRAESIYVSFFDFSSESGKAPSLICIIVDLTILHMLRVPSFCKSLFV